MPIKVSLFHVLFAWLVFVLLNVSNVCRGEHDRVVIQTNHDFNDPATAVDRKDNPSKPITDEQISKGRKDRDKFVPQISNMELPSSSFDWGQQILPNTLLAVRPKSEGKQHLSKTENSKKEAEKLDEEVEAKKSEENQTIKSFPKNSKAIFKKRPRREATNHQSCRFPSFLETSPLCLVSKLTPGQVCKWIHTRQGRTPLFPFPNIVSPYRNWELQVSSAKIRNDENSYIFDCVKQYNKNQYLVKITGNVKEIGRHPYTSFLCLKFIPRGLNVVQYMVSENSNISENLNCSTEPLKYAEQVLVSDKFRELPDCPHDLRGAFKLERVHDAVHNVTCNLNPLKASLLESDCAYKEGIHLDFSGFRDCKGFNLDTNGVRYSRDVLHLRCYSASWQERDWSYVVVKRDKATRKIEYSNTKMFYCMRFKKDPMTTNIKLYIFFDYICKLNLSQLENSSQYFVLDLVSLASSLLPAAKQTELEQLRCDFPTAILGQWIEQSAYSGEHTIRIEKHNIEMGKDGKFTCMLSDRGRGVGQLFPTYSCNQNIWMERRRISNFNYNFILVSANLSIGCRPRFVGFSILRGEAPSDIHFTYRLSQSVVLPIHSVPDPMLFVQKSLGEKFCRDRDLFRLDPYPQWGRNIEKIVVRPNVLTTEQASMDCRFQGPLPDMFSGKVRVNVVDGGMGSTKCPGIIDSCSSPTKIHLQYNVSCGNQERSYGCLGRVWDTKPERRQNHYFLQDLKTRQIYCVRADSGFEIVRAASVQCYDFYWGLTAFQQRFHETIDIVAQGFMECPTAISTTGGVFKGTSLDPNITTTRPIQHTNKTKVINASGDSSGGTNIISLIIAVILCL